MRIKQAVGIIKWNNGNTSRLRISRRLFSDLVNYYQKKPGFHYMKIYDIPNYVKHTNHTKGKQIGFITLKGSKIDTLGLTETTQSINFKQLGRY